MPALALDFPVVSGNVCLYNETNGEAILPTPAIGGVGLLSDATGRQHRLQGGGSGHPAYRRNQGSCSAARSICARSCGREEGPPPPVDLAAERRNGDFVRSLISEAGRSPPATTCPMAGLLVALAEMAMAGKLGADIDLPAGVDRRQASCSARIRPAMS